MAVERQQTRREGVGVNGNLIPYRRGEARARVFGRLGALKTNDQRARQKALVSMLQDGLGLGISVAQAELEELVAKIRSGKKLSAAEHSRLRWWSELLAKHCKGVVPQLVQVLGLHLVGQVDRLPTEQVAELRGKWEQMQAGGLLDAEGLPMGQPSDYVEAQVSEEEEGAEE